MITRKTCRNATTACVMLAGALAVAPSLASAQDVTDVKPSKPLNLREEGSFFVGGKAHQVANAYAYRQMGGNSVYDQMYVQFQKPQKRNKQWPIVFVHGCCLTSKTWETTPDGRMGWYEYFTRRGFDTYMGEQVGRGRSGFDALRFQEVHAGDLPASSNPAILIATDQFAWNVFRWGNYATLTPYEDEQFPMETVGVGSSSLTFYKQVIPDLNSTLDKASSSTCADGNCTPADPNAAFNSPDAMAKLANDLGGAILVGHSQSSGFPTMAALRPWAKGVKGIIQLETGCFANLTPQNISVLKDIPILIVVGDHQTSPQPPSSCTTEMNQINGAGGDMTFISLPDVGLHGNSHMFMQDKNNLQVADVIINWINTHVKNRRGKVAKALS